MLSNLTMLLCLSAPITTGEAAPASSPAKPAASAEKAPAPKEKSPAKSNAPQKDSPIKEDKKEPAKKSAAEKKDKDSDLHPIEVSVISLTNEQRKKFGMTPLEVDKTLMVTARKHCGWMTRNRIFQHGGYNVAENIAMGQRDSGQVLSAWMNSSGHRANILNPRHRRIGVSAYRTKDGTIYWCQQFRN